MRNKKAKKNIIGLIFKFHPFYLIFLITPILFLSNIAQPRLVSTAGSYQCGTGSDKQITSIDFGCKGDACIASAHNSTAVPAYCLQNTSPITDLLFSLIRFLSDGVGLVIIGSIIFAGIQYTTAGGDPQNVAKAVKRIRSSITALIFFIFIYAILNYLIPAGFFKS